MESKIIFETKILGKYNMDIDELLYLISLYYNVKINDKTIDKLNSKGLIFKDIENNCEFYTLNRDSRELLSNIIIDSSDLKETKRKQKDNDRFYNLAIKLREIYPAGVKDGTHYQWRDSTSIITTRLKGLILKYNADFTDEEAIDATKRYVESFNGNYTYMQLLKYFISKREIKDGETVENSQLLSYIENKDNITYNNDWVSTLR